jgi:hypothetical protein
MLSRPLTCRRLLSPNNFRLERCLQGKSLCQIRQYASAIAHHGGSSVAHHEDSIIRMSEVKKLSELSLHYSDSHLGEEELASKVITKLKKLESEVLARNQAFNEAHPIVFDPKRALNDEIFLCCSICCVLFLIFLYNQYEEFAHELSFDIRDKFGVGFYMLLGLHGSHVVVGTIMLALFAFWGAQNRVGPFSHGFRFVSLYVHLVDLVFIILVFAVYSANGSSNLYYGNVPEMLEGRMYVKVDEEGNATAKEF